MICVGDKVVLKNVYLNILGVEFHKDIETWEVIDISNSIVKIQKDSNTMSVTLNDIFKQGEVFTDDVQFEIM